MKNLLGLTTVVVAVTGRPSLYHSRKIGNPHLPNLPTATSTTATHHERCSVVDYCHSETKKFAVAAGASSSVTILNLSRGGQLGGGNPNDNNDDDDYQYYDDRGYNNNYNYNQDNDNDYNDYYGDQPNADKSRYGDDEYDDRGYYNDPRPSQKGSTMPSKFAAIPNIVTKGNRKIGLGLLSLGTVFTVLGVFLFFNKTLMRLGNLMFIAGVPMTIGPGRTAGYFLQPQKARATGCLVVGIFLVFVGWPVIGIALEVFGLLNIFGNMFPFLMIMLKQMPFIGPLLKRSDSNSGGGGGGFGGMGRSSRRDDRDDYYDDRRYYDDDDNDNYY